MSEVELGLNYVLPRTMFSAEVVARSNVIERANKHFLEKVFDVGVQFKTVGDVNHECILDINIGLLEKMALILTLDDDGFITSINSEAGRDISPVISVVGKALGAVASIAALGVLPIISDDVAADRESDLETQWEEQFGEVDKIRKNLIGQLDRLTISLTDTSTPYDQLFVIGQGLEVLQSQLSSISESRREWIAGQTAEGATETYAFSPANLYRITNYEFPLRFDRSVKSIEGPVGEFAEKFGVLLALIDPRRPSTVATNSDFPADCITIRRSRPVRIGMYTKSLGDTWVLDLDSVRTQDVVDEFSRIDTLSLNGSWLRSRHFEIAFHSDMSIKTFGMSSTPQAAALATSTGEVVGALTEGIKGWRGRPTAEERALATAKTQLSLLETTSAQEILAGTKNRAVELAVLEQKKKLRDASN